MNRLAWIASMVILLPVGGALSSWLTGAPTHPILGSEPSGTLDIYARVLSRAPAAASERVIVELTVLTHRTLPEATIHASASADGRPSRALETRSIAGPFRARSVRKIEYGLQLDPGMRHHLRFTATAGDPGDPTAEASAYLLVDLDPARQPEEPEGLIQYRATTAGR